MQIIAQLIGFAGMGALFISYQQSERKKLIFFKLVADVIWVVHYMMLGAVGGAIPNFVGIFRELVFMRRDDTKKWSRSPLVPLAFIAVSWTLAILSWKSALNLLPICASTFVTISLWVKRPALTRAIGAPVSVTFIIYDIFVGSYSGIINETVALVSIVTSYLRNDRKKHARGESCE